MSNYKMLCLDIDGTLLNSNNELLEETKKSIIELSSKKKVPVILVSARMPKGIEPIKQELKLLEPMICYSGSLILDKSNRLISHNYINFNLALKIAKLAKEENVHVSLYREDHWFVEAMDKWAQAESDIIGIIPEVINFNELTSNNCGHKEGFNKILFIGEKEKISKIKEELNEEYSAELNIHNSKPTYLEVMSKYASKTSAIRTLMSLYNVKEDEVVAVGDSFNDIDMIKFASVGVAMGNAAEEVKKISDYVTKSNDENGISKVVEKFFN